MAEGAMGGLGSIALVMDRASDKWPFSVEVRSSQPVLACLGSQYAGWNLSSEGYFAMGSGPARALARVEPLFRPCPIATPHRRQCLSWRPPNRRRRKSWRRSPEPPDCLPKSSPSSIAPTQSLAGTVQIVSRVLEVALHKANDLKFPLDNIVDGIGAAPIPAPHPGFPHRHGPHQRRHHLWRASPSFSCADRRRPRKRLAQKLPSSASRDYGQPFAKIFKQFKGDFYAIDPLLFSPAEVIVTAIETGDTFRAGGRDLNDARAEPRMTRLSSDCLDQPKDKAE